MASTYVNDLRLNEMATGDASGTWGTVTNTNLELIGEALSFGTEAITTNADTHTTTVADGAADPGRAMYLKYTGTLDSACTITIAPNTISRMHFIENGTSGSQNIIISQGSGANVTIPAGDTKAVYLDGAGSGAAVVDAFASLNVVDLKVEDDLTVTDDLIVNGDIDLEGSIDVNGTTNLDVVDIDGAVDMASTLQVDGAITSSAGATITVADNSDNLTLTSTDADASVGPNLNLYRNSGSPADDDVTGVIVFNGRNDNSQDVIYARQLSYIKDASDGTEDGQLTLQTMVAGTIRDRLNITPAEIVLNEDSVDVDFRVESNGNTNMIFVDAGNDHVNIGTSTDLGGVLNVHSDDNTDTLVAYSSDADSNEGPVVRLWRNSASPADGDNIGYLYYTGENSADEKINYVELLGSIEDVTNATEDGVFNIQTMVAGTARSRILVDSTGIVLNDASQDLDFRVESNGNANMFFVDAYNDKVGVGTNSPSGTMEVRMTHTETDVTTANSNETLVLGNTGAGDGIYNALRFGGNQQDMYIMSFNDSTQADRRLGFFVGSVAGDAAGDERFTILGNGFLGINNTAPESVSGAAGPVLRMSGSNPEIVFDDTNGTANQLGLYYLNYTLQFHSPQKSGGAGSAMSVNVQSGNVNVAGALSKGSGSFRIDHPLEAKKDTHNLIHSFIEGPQADLIYRGKVNLVDGAATVNLDVASGMTEGTFVLLNTNTQCFTSNESGWTAVKGSVSGNTLTITSEVSCTDTISWMVVGERHDQHMKDTDWTDSNGKVIVEPLKEEE